MVMKTSEHHSIHRTLDIRYEDLLPFFKGFSEGVIFVDRSGTIIYYNPAMAKIDELVPSEVLGKKIVDVYDLTCGDSLIMQCLKRKEAIIDRSLLYRTRRGKVANTIHTVFPLFKRGRLEGAICLVREYNVLEETISSISIPRSKQQRPNDTRFDFDSIIGGNLDFLRAVNTAKMAANTPTPVMLCGETGTGKELFAQAIHNRNGRKNSPYIAVNCAAIPENLLEGLLFGTTSGAFTGARERLGLFERARGGTIFLDELNSMGTGLQAKILRVIQERKVRRLGSLRETEIDAKIISSVDKEPHVAIAENNLRPDLFYRLGVVLIPIPPLRGRRDDIDLLARHFLIKHSQALSKELTDISENVCDLFHEYNWPGNVRELEHVIEGAINMVVSSRTIEMRHLQSHLTTWWRKQRSSCNIVPPSGNAPAPGNDFTRTEELHKRIPVPLQIRKKDMRKRGKGLQAIQAEQEKTVLAEALTTYQGHITRAANELGISRQLFNYKMRKYSICRDDFLV
jgi:arginine utilization regulatory protein